MDEQDIDIRIKAALDASEAANSAKELKASMRELNALGNEIGDTNEAAFLRIKEAAGAAALKVREMNESTRALAGTPLTATTKSFGLMKESLMTLNFDQLSKSVTLFSGSLQKLNPGQLSEGFGKLGSSLATLGKTLLTNPIFLIGAVIAFIIVKFNELKEAGGLIGKMFSFIGDVIHTVIKAVTAFTDAIGLTDLAAKKAQENRLKYLEKEKSAIEERYAHETKMAELTNKNVGLIEIEKYNAQTKSAKEIIAIYTKIKEEKGYLTDEETEKYKEALQDYKKIQDAELEYVQQTNKKILDTEKEVLKDIKQAKINNLSDDTAKKKAQAEFDLEQKKEEVKKQTKEQIDGLETLKAAEIQSANGSAEAIKAINEKYAIAERIVVRESAEVEKEANEKKNDDIDKANEEAFNKKRARREKEDAELLNQNKAQLGLITNDLKQSEEERYSNEVKNLNERKKLLETEKNDRIALINTSIEFADKGSEEEKSLLDEKKKISNDYNNNVKATTQEQEKLLKDFEDKKKEAAKAEEERIKKQKNDEVNALITIATERKQAATTYKEQLAADVELANLNSKKKVINEKLSTEQILALWISTLAHIQKLKETYADKEKQQLLKDAVDGATAELSALEKKKGIWLGKELAVINQLNKSKLALLNKQMQDELKTVEKGSEQEAKIRKKYADLEAKQYSDAQAQRVKDAVAAINQIGGYAAQGLQAANALSDLADQADKNRLAKGQKLSEETQKKEFKRKQALSLAGAILNTAEGISKAVAESPDTGGLPGSAIAAVMGGLQIAKILSTKFEASGDGAASSGGDSATPSISAPSSSAAPTLASSTKAGQFYGIGTQNYNGNATKAQPQQVYVLESDITNSQNKVAVIQQRATLSGGR